MWKKKLYRKNYAKKCTYELKMTAIPWPLSMKLHVTSWNAVQINKSKKQVHIHTVTFSSSRIYFNDILQLYSISSINCKLHSLSIKRDLRDFVANELVCNIRKSKFDLQSRHKVHFRTNILGKGWDFLKHPWPLQFVYNAGIDSK